MRCRLHTLGGTLGYVDLVDGADVRDVVAAIREHRLFCTPVVDAPEAAPAPAGDAKQPAADAGTEAPPPRRRARA